MHNHHLNPIELAAYQALLEASGLLQQRMGQQLKQDGDITSPQFEILAYVAKAPGGLRMSDLAARAVHSKSGITYRVGQLEKLGLVTRSGNTDDERSVIVKSTPKGVALMRRVLPRHLELLRASFLDVLAPDDLLALSDILTRVVAHLRGFDEQLSKETERTTSRTTRKTKPRPTGSRPR